MAMSRKYGRRFCQPWPSRRAMASVRAKVKAITAPRDRLKRPMHQVVEELNPVLRGWGNYFRWGNSTRVFTQIDSYVHQRVALFDSKKRGRRGPRWATEHNYEAVTRRTSRLLSSRAPDHFQVQNQRFRI